MKQTEFVIDRVASKDAEIEKICGDNYQDFIASLSTLSSIKTYTTNLRETITTLDSNVAQIGRGVVEKKRALLQSKKTAANLDEAIDTMQACLRVLDVVNRVGEMVREGKYWSALRVRKYIIHQAPLHSTNIITRIVPRRHPKHASNLTLPDSTLSASTFIPSITSRSNQRCCDSIAQPMATRNAGSQRASGRSSIRCH